MSGADALLWTVGRDPVLRPTIVAIMALDRSPDFAKVRARTERLTVIVPRLRARVVTKALGRGRPTFVAESRFDLDAHLRHIVLPQPGTFRDVLDIGQIMATSSFDEALPLWEALLVDGVGTQGASSSEGAALILKIHHCLIDGVGGMAVLLHLLDAVRRPPRVRERAAQSKRPAAGSARAPTGLFDRIPDLEQVFETTVRRATHPFQEIEQIVATATSAVRLVAPSGKPISPIMTERGFRRGLEVLDMPLQPFRDASKATGGSLNDIFVSAIACGLRNYHEVHGVSIDHLRALMPVNVRSSDDAQAGNHFVPARFLVPIATDAGYCVREVRKVTGSWKHAPGLALSDVLANALSVLPPAVISAMWGSMLKGDDFCITNVPGPPFETFLAGARVDQMYAFAPASGAALNVSLVTPAERACIGITVDTAAVPDSAKLATCLGDGFDEVLLLGHAAKGSLNSHREPHGKAISG